MTERNHMWVITSFSLMLGYISHLVYFVYLDLVHTVILRFHSSYISILMSTISRLPSFYALNWSLCSQQTNYLHITTHVTLFNSSVVAWMVWRYCSVDIIAATQHHGSYVRYLSDIWSWRLIPALIVIIVVHGWFLMLWLRNSVTPKYKV